MTFKKVATVNLMGGLGNQLHQIVFSKYLQDHGHSVIIDLSWYNVPKFSDGSKIFYPNPWFKSILHKPYTEKNWSPIEY